MKGMSMKEILEYADILAAAPFSLIYARAAGKFCKKYLGASKRNERLFILLSFGGGFILELAGRKYLVPYIFTAVFHVVFYMGLVMLLFWSDREKRILAASMLLMNARLAGVFCVSLLSGMVLFFRHIVQKIPEPFLSGRENVLIDCIQYGFVIFTVYWMYKHLEPVFDGKPGKWYAVLAVPLLVIIIVYDVASWGASNGILLRSGGRMGLYYDQIFSHAEFFLLSLLCMAAAIFYVFGMHRIYAEQEKSSRYHSQIAVYKMLAEQYRQSESLRHDMKNHIIALSALSRNKEWENLSCYLKNMEESGLETGADLTGSSAVDAILYQKRKRAKEEEIQWECDVQIPKDGTINEFDLCVLFGNILDNAIEACERIQCGGCRFICIQAKIVKKCFLLEVKNSMDMAQECGKRFTEKDKPQEHGIGLMNVSDVVRGYNGVMHKEAENSCFAISILIPLSGAAHDMKTSV